ncbi:MAG: hypothetical protein UW07_C0025G0012 [Candidatus Nomurabacteria bacterium GW2011_GWF2_43_8]|uniref:GrpB family protein n=3 Tax=Candidatus Nomuraibacteriota TaxID=1752729 RepID=A0A0G1FMP6_9BACT|nr:MAG: hypothetical protein UV76_C0004G0036 [Candidatus Nomurabacteria bacterium GW2011_GWA2_43_15]KKT20129.1 MAG: hypothetical protein UW02_C0001G0042 [Candidatus Nomurabacteria bacterium GW2011_GWB1_43_7]KKT23253.1 MAG: hypothetical protein UW07_C0025G0012 [Candidatus Nomurabacteria bacterium GW2011_GWF2_43_8]
MKTDLGLGRTTVTLKQHNKNWKKLFDEEKEFLLSHFPDDIFEVSHGGSTSIPGIPAKPIIDMFAVVPSLQIARQLKDRLATFNYHYRGEEGVPGRILYAKGDAENRTHYLQLVEKESNEWKNHLLIKNYYLHHPEVAQEYAKLKKTLAKKYPKDRKAYSAGKDVFIKGVIAKALQETGI